MPPSPIHQRLPSLRLWWVFLLLATPLLAAACATPKRSFRGPPGATLYQVSLKRAEGGSLSFARFKGKVVLVNFFATSCARCEVVQIPLFKGLHDKYEHKGFEVVGVAVQPQARQFLQPFMKVLGISYPILIGDGTIVQGRTVFGRVNSIPRSYLFGRCGKIKHFYYGAIKAQALENKIKGLLGQSASCR